MRKLGAALLALPVLAVVYAVEFVRRARPLRLGAGIAAAAVVVALVLASQTPAPSTALPPSAPRPVDAELLSAVRTGQPLTQAFELQFGAPMDAASVAGALRIAPEAAIRLTWNQAGTLLTVAPVAHWTPDTLYAITVAGTARASDGGPLSSPVQAAFLTTSAGSARIATSDVVDGRARLDAQIRIDFDRPVDVTAVEAALHTEPAVSGDLAPGSVPDEVVFTPRSGLAPGTTYSFSLDGLVDQDGVPFVGTPSLELTTVAAPAVVRFRPFDGTRHVQRTATLSVRFTEPMRRTVTAQAFHVVAAGKPVKGTVSWAEQRTVLVFQPASALPYGAKITMSVDASARSAAGVALAKAASGTFTVQPKPAPPATPAATPIPRTGGGGAVAGSWHSVELYYLKLMNCTRTGGWVTSTGKCSSPGGRNVAPLKLSAGISDHVSRPYAKLLATRNLCDHFVGGTPGDRLRAAGYKSYRWAENIGCLSMGPYAAMLSTHRYFQNEKSYNGGHYVNMMNAAYDRVGIGVWVASGRVRLVVDFYHP